jgi:hypothetical protein
VIEKVPSDTTMHGCINVVSPAELRRLFKKIFAYLQRGKALKGYRYLIGHHIISLDGSVKTVVKNIIEVAKLNIIITS